MRLTIYKVLSMFAHTLLVGLIILALAIWAIPLAIRMLEAVTAYGG